MKKTKILVVSKFADSHCPYIERSLHDDFIIECYSRCDEIPFNDNSRPLIQPDHVILFFLEGWSIAEVQRDVQALCPPSLDHKLYAILYITDAERLDEVTALLKEDDDVILDTYNPVILQPKLRQLAKRSNLLKKLHRDLRHL